MTGRLGNMQQGTSTTVTMAIIAFACLCVMCVAGLSALGRDVGQLIYFISGFVPVTIGVILANRKIDNVSHTVQDIHEQVNGNMTARIDSAVSDVKEHVTETVKENGNGAPTNDPPTK